MISIRPLPGNRLVDVVVDGLSQGQQSFYTFENVVEHHLLQAVFSGCEPRAFIPNQITARTYDDAGLPAVRHLVPDGFGALAQAQLELPGDKVLLEANFVDGLGYVTKEVKPFVVEGVSGFQYQDMACGELINRANAYYDGSSPERPDAEGYAFAQARLTPDPLARVSGLGLPGKATSLDAAEGHGTRIWRFGAAGADAFVPAEELDAAALDARESTWDGTRT